MQGSASGLNAFSDLAMSSWSGSWIIGAQWDSCCTSSPPGNRIISPFTGLIDEFKIFNRALNATEVASEYASGANYGEGNAYANVLDGSVPIFGSTQSVGMPAYNIGSSGGGYPYKNTTAIGKFICGFANCADYAPLIRPIPVTYTCRIIPDVPYMNDTLQGMANSPGSLSNNVTYSYQWYLNGTLNCTANEGSVHVG